MNFKLFNESEDKLELILRDCQPILKEIGTKYTLLRGIRDSFMFRKFSVWQNRSPVDISPEGQNAFNEAFEKIYGIKDIRSKAVFTTGHCDNAEEYGQVYLIFPIGNYTYWWSPQSEDLYGDWYEEARTAADLYTSAEKFLKKNKYKNNELEKALNTGHEIMLLCDSYYAIHHSNPVLTRLRLINI